MTSPLIAHAATRDDLPFIARLFAASNTSEEFGVGYPRCDDADEILAELAVYQASLESSFHVLHFGDGSRVGTFGFLFDEDMAFAYLAGPLMDEGARHSLEDALVCAECFARGKYPELRSSVVDRNRALVSALDQRGWVPRGESLEMVFDLDQPDPAARRAGSSASAWCIERLVDREAPRFAAVADLLGRTHGWVDGEQRLAEYLEQGYRVAFVPAPGKDADGGAGGRPDDAVGATTWIHLKNTSFSRLDYVSTHESWRGRGIAAALVDDAIADARSAGDRHLYLSLDPRNAVAHRLYLRAGFRDGLRSIIYAREQLG